MCDNEKCEVGEYLDTGSVDGAKIIGPLALARACLKSIRSDSPCERLPEAIDLLAATERHDLHGVPELLRHEFQLASAREETIGA